MQLPPCHEACAIPRAGIGESQNGVPAWRSAFACSGSSVPGSKASCCHWLTSAVLTAPACDAGPLPHFAILWDPSSRTGDVDVHGTQSGDSAASASAKGKQQAAASSEVVQALVAQQGADTEAVRAGAEARSKAHRAACEAEEAALREQVAAEEEASRCENRAIDLEWEQLQASLCAHAACKRGRPEKS